MSIFWERDPQKRWEQNTRQWWMWLSIGVATATITMPLLARYTRFGIIGFGLLAVLVAFQAGFFYNDRLRQLRKTSGFLPNLRRPPNESHPPQASG